eukprot:TRINITY_DN16457_c0_g1_i1.p2 TRINITY_DN16457_c0_g1~~TRINITY_DN16457_c0_g1_i1.p2  ORF type:complete len:412 (-),score=145.23 TRINITY_DN16457_c0_g1_i1:78-1313(-)
MKDLYMPFLSPSLMHLSLFLIYYNNLLPHNKYLLNLLKKKNMNKVVYGIIVLFFLINLINICYAGEDYYNILGIKRDASTKEIRKAYRDLSLKWHPDKNPDNREEATKKFEKISRAKEILTDEEKRRIYDQYGEEGLDKQNNRGRGGGAGDFFSNFFNFGGRNQGGAGAMKKGPDIGLPLFVSLEDLYNGKTIKIAHRKQVLCNKCRGTGAKNPDDVKTCPVCNGSGTKMETRKLGPGFIQQIQTQCDKCGGKGHVVKTKCPHCHGDKVEIGEEELVIIIERGMPDKYEIRFSQQADEAPDTTPGDVYFTLVTKEHPDFVRRGDDLYLNMKITLLEALVGFSKTVTHLDGHKVPITRTHVAKPGMIQLIKNEGMPHHQFPSQKGNLYVEYEVIFPSVLTEKQKDGFRDLLA